jgi:hypothetical protein
VKVAEPAAAALREQYALAMRREIRHRRACLVVPDDCADWYPQFDIVAASAETICAAPMFTVTRDMPARVTVVNQGIDISIGSCPYASAVATVSAVGPSLRNEFLTAKRGTSVASMTTDDFDSCLVDELHNEKTLPMTAGLSLESVDCRGID